MEFTNAPWSLEDWSIAVRYQNCVVYVPKDFAVVIILDLNLSLVAR